MANVIVWDGTTQIPADVRRALIVARDGFFQLKRLVLNGLVVIEAITRIGDGWEDDGLQPWGSESVRLGFAEKIPLALLQQAIAFFRVVYERFQSEAIVFLFYAPGAPAGQHWQIMAPEQEVSPGHCVGHDPGPAPSGWFLAGTIHSHGNMGGFHSGQDNRDEEERDGIHITVGGVSTLPSFAVSVVVDGVRFKLDLADIVEGIPPVQFPAEWLERVRRLVPQLSALSLMGVGRSGFDEPPEDSEEALATHRAVRTVRPAKSRKGG